MHKKVISFQEHFLGRANHIKRNNKKGYGMNKAVNSDVNTSEDLSTPQIEDGFARISNELIEFYMANKALPAWLRIHWAVIRYSYSYKKKHTKVYLGSLAKACGILPNHISREFKRCVSSGMIRVAKKISPGCYYVTVGKNKNSFKKPTTQLELYERKSPHQVGRKSPHQVGNKITSSGFKKTSSGDYTIIKENIKENKERVAGVKKINGNEPKSSKEFVGNSQPFSLHFSTHQKPPSKISTDWQPDDDLRAYAKAKGMESSDLVSETEKFVLYNLARGDKRRDWTYQFKLWCIRWGEHHDVEPPMSEEQQDAELQQILKYCAEKDAERAKGNGK